MKLKKYFKIFNLLVKINLAKQFAYRLSFWLAILGKSLRIGIEVIFFGALYFKIPQIGQWNFNQVLLLLGTFNLVQLLVSITFHRNMLYWFPRDLKKGDFDFTLVKPLSSLFWTSFQIIDFMDLTSLIPTFILLGIAFLKLQIEILSLDFLFYLLLIFNAYLFVYGLVLIIATFAFWTITTTSSGRLFESIMRIGRYPTDIFGGILRIILVYIIPIILIATLPAQVLIKGLDFQSYFFAFTFSFIFLFLGILFWRFGLKRYSSASS